MSLMRSLLVALDDTPAGTTAVTFALSLAARHGAKVAGLNVLDVGYLTAPQPGGIGSAHYKFRTDLARLKQGHERGERLAAAFLEQCATRNVKGDVVDLEGDAVEQVRNAAATHDLIVIGRDSNLHGEQPGSGLSKTVARILRENPRPLVIAPEAAGDTSRAVVAYDGSVPAARSLQLFTLLGLAAKCELHVVSVDADQERSDARARQASAYLSLHGVASRMRSIASAADPADLVIAEARSLGADLLVMGAYGHRGWKEALIGSFTTRLLSHCPTALFIHH
jgi:nucleotide-binding universal stress UspA family protein